MAGRFTRESYNTSSWCIRTSDASPPCAARVGAFCADGPDCCIHEFVTGDPPTRCAEAHGVRAFARAFRQAVSLDERVRGIPSTKGAL